MYIHNDRHICMYIYIYIYIYIHIYVKKTPIRDALHTALIPQAGFLAKFLAFKK